MKDIFVLVYKDTGDFFANTGSYNRKRAVQAYTSEGRALSALKQMRGDTSNVIVKRYTA